MAVAKDATVKVRLDTSELLQQLDELPDELLDRLADKLVGRIERRLLDRGRRRGDR
jgi:hypothetical protein